MSLVRATDALLGGEFGARLARFAADARSDEASAGRARVRWLQQAAAEESTMAGMLVDLAEQHASVTIETRTGRRHHGQLEAVGKDFIALRTEHGSETLVALDAVAAVRTATTATPVGDRTSTVNLALRGVLTDMAGDRPLIQVGLCGCGDAVTGVLGHVGRDVLTVSSDRHRGDVFVPIQAVAHVTLV